MRNQNTANNMTYVIPTARFRAVAVLAPKETDDLAVSTYTARS